MGIMEKKRRILMAVVTLVLTVVILISSTVVVLNIYVKTVGGKYIVTAEEAKDYAPTDCILVLGCGVNEDGTPSAMLRDRLEKSVELYFTGVSDRIIMSGDHGKTDYDEVNVMKQYAIDRGVPSEKIFMDHAGFSTYESIYRAKEIFQVRNMVVITQEYHIYRALFLCEKLGVTAYGVTADYYIYAGQGSREIREMLARCKDVVTSITKPEPTYLGEAIPVSGNGDITNDK